MPAAPLVTVCIPAYRAANFLPQTLASVRDQEFTDFRVRVAIEPAGAQATLEACAEFTDDERFELVVNDHAYGWPGNVQHLLDQVTTRYFTLLPHDDLWHPRYLAALVNRLASRPDAVAVYADSYLFVPPAGIRTIDLVDGATAEQLLSFFVHGAHGFPWRAVTRSCVLDNAFPDNDFRGFFVECEWVAYLILRGRVLRQPEPLYLHRLWPDEDPDSMTVSWRFGMDQEQLGIALTHHREMMLGLVRRANIDEGKRRLIELAVETAVLVLAMLLSASRFELPGDWAQRYETTAAALEVATGEGASELLSRLLVARSRHLLQLKNEEQSHALAERAIELAPTNGDALMLMARQLLRRRRAPDALTMIERASAASPMAVGLTELQLECSRQLAAGNTLVSQQ